MLSVDSVDVPRPRTGELGPQLRQRGYWVAPGRLLAGAYPGDRDLAVTAARLRELRSAGIRHIVSLMEPSEDARFNRQDIVQLARRYGMTTGRHAVPDMDVPTPVVMRAVLDEIDAHVGAGSPVYVHCNGGLGRTGVVAACWLIRHREAPPGDAVDHLAALRVAVDDPELESPQTPVQREFVRGWQPGS